MTDRIPCRVMGDLARHEADLRDAVNDAFDEYDEMHVRAVVPYELAPAIQQLLLTRSQINMTEGSFGADPAAVTKAIKEDLDRLYRACVDRWRDL